MIGLRSRLFVCGAALLVGCAPRPVDDEDAADSGSDGATGPGLGTGGATEGNDDGSDGSTGGGGDGDAVPGCTGASVWHDAEAGLCWEHTPNDQPIGFFSAVEYCSDLALGGYSDWEMPSIQELVTLLRGCDQSGCELLDNPHCEENCYSGCATDCEPWGGPGEGGCFWAPDLGGSCDNEGYWSSTSPADHDDGVWRIFFHWGDLDLTGKDDPSESQQILIRCVRPAG
jgi:hypothetical protein